MKSKGYLFVAITSACFVAAAAGNPFTPGNLVVSRVGTGAAALSNAATPVFLDEISPLGSTVQTVELPALATTSGNRALTLSGTATSEGFLSRSVDGRFLTLGGYNADAGTAAVVNTPSSTVPRVVGRISADGTINTTTAFDGDLTYSANNIRSAITTDGENFWVGGTAGGTNGGVRYATLGANTSMMISDAPTNTRVVGIFNDQLYVTTMTGAFRGVNAVGTGIPTTPSQTTVLLPGFDPITTSPQSAYAFYFADTATLYVADDRTLVNGGGVQKWTFDGTTWTLQYTLNTGLTAGVRDIAGKTEGGTTTLYVTTADGISAANGNKLMMVTDTGALSEYVLIATAPGNTAFRGVAFAPEDGGPVCYANCDGSTVEPVLNIDDFTCFINEFAIAQTLTPEQQVTAYANCDGSTIQPVLNIDDFTCFINTFALGCP